MDTTHSSQRPAPASDGLSSAPRFLMAMVFCCLALGNIARAAELSAAERERLEALQQRPIHQSTNVVLAEHLQLRSKSWGAPESRPDPRQGVGEFGRGTVGQPFRMFAVQFDPAESDCVSFVNNMLAYSLASDWDSYYILIERIRHKDGVVEYRNRNFETLGDWLPNNAWLLRDITAGLGSPDHLVAKPFTHVVYPKRFLERPAAPGSSYTRITFLGADKESGARDVRADSFIPADQVGTIASELRTGDVVLVLVKDGDEHLRADHHALIVEGDDGAHILHSAPPGVREEPLATFLKRCHWVSGFKFLRMRDSARDIAAQEVARLAPGIRVTSPAAQDAKNSALRAKRAANPSTRPSN